MHAGLHERDGERQRPRSLDQEHAVISVFDHGFLYGEGVYETLRTYNGEPFLFDRHMRRLRTSASMLASRRAADRRGDRRAISRDDGGGAASAPQGDEAYIRILVTRGIGELTYDPAACPDADVVIIVKPHVDARRPRRYERRRQGGARRRSSATIPGSVNPLIKSNNLLNNALAMQEAFRRGGVRRRDAELSRRARRVHDRRTSSSSRTAPR